MRGQYEVWIPRINVPATEGSIAGIIVPANTIAQLNRIELIGRAAASNNGRVRVRRFTGNTPTLSNAVVAKARARGNALPASVTVGGRGSGGSGAVWSATPTTPDAEEIFGNAANLFGGRIAWASTLQESIDIGGASASYYDVLGEAESAVDAALLLVFSE